MVASTGIELKQAFSHHFHVIAVMVNVLNISRDPKNFFNQDSVKMFRFSLETSQDIEFISEAKFDMETFHFIDFLQF